METTETNGTTAIVKRAERTEVVRAEVIEPMSWPDMVRMGEQLVKTRMMPEHVRDGAQAALIMLTGRELGMAPMRALRSLQVVKGKVVESADSQLSRFKADGGRAEFKHLDEKKAVLWLKHPNGDEHTETWSIDDAKAAGLSGGMHSKYPKAMNRSRAITAGLKSIGWEGGVGTYDPDEARAFTDDEPKHTAAPTTTKVTATVAVSPSYRPDDERRKRMSELLTALEVGKGQKEREKFNAERQAYLAEINGGSMPENNDETDALISELEGRVNAKREQDDSAEASVIDAPPNG